MNIISRFGAARATISSRIRSASLLSLMLGVFIASTIAPPIRAADPVTSTPPQTFRGFVDPDKVIVAEGQAEVRYLGAGRGGTAYLTNLTAESWAGSEFGFDADNTDLDVYRKTTEYTNTQGFRTALAAEGSVVREMVLGVVYNTSTDPTQSTDIVAAVVVENPGSGTSTWLIGPMDEGFPSAVRVRTDNGAPKIAMVNQGRGLATTLALVDGLGTTLVTYRVSVAQSLIPSVIASSPGFLQAGTYRPNSGRVMLDIAHRPSHELPFRSDLEHSGQGIVNSIFLTLQGERIGNTSKWRPLVLLHGLGPTGTIFSSQQLNTINTSVDALTRQQGRGPASLEFNGDEFIRNNQIL